MARPTRAARTLGLAAILLSVAGCAASTIGTASAAPPSVAGASAPTPIASFAPFATATPTPAEVGTTPEAGTYSNASTPRGAESFTLTADGKYTMKVAAGPKTDNKALSITGTWTYGVGAMRFIETGGGSCGKSPGSYSWAFDGKTVTLGIIGDPCTIRTQDLVSGPWAKS